MYGFHLWLPKAHVEASVEGSMILAGVLLKLGRYGIFRIFIFLSVSLEIFLIILLRLRLVRCVIVGFICYRQIDIKMIIAYSSVAHMGILLGGLLSLSKIGAYGGLRMILAHGFCSRGLFFMGNIFYTYYKTRNLLFMKGRDQLSQVLMNIWLIFRFIRMGVPPFINFCSEILLLVSIMKVRNLLIMVLFLILVINTVYGLNIYLRVGYGLIYFYKLNLGFIYHNVKLIMVIHIELLLIFILKINFFIK